jgi:uncharacterized protein involved in cysteine biosynthesis
MDVNHPPSAKRKPLPAPNPETRDAHRREISRQVILPLIIALIIFFGVGAWLIWAGAGTVERWAQIAMIVMILSVIMLGLLVFGLAIGLLFLITQVLRILPPYARLAQDAIMKINHRVKAGADISVRPIIELHKFLAMVDVLLGKRKK